MDRKSVKIKNRKICIGNMNKRITIQTRSLTTNNIGSIETIETFTDDIDVWAAIETTRGNQLWDGVEVSNPFTHNIYIRYRDDINFEKWIKYKDEEYDVVDVEDFEQANDFLLLRCIRKGSKTKEANFA